MQTNVSVIVITSVLPYDGTMIGRYPRTYVLGGIFCLSQGESNDRKKNFLLAVQVPISLLR